MPTASDWERMISWALDDSRKSGSTPHSSRTSSIDPRISKQSESSHHSSNFDISSISYPEDAEWLKWKCFVRFTSKCHCLVTIIPDNLDVIKRIVLGRKDSGLLDSLYHDVECGITDPENMTASVTARNDSCSFYTTCSSSSRDLPDEQDEIMDRTPVETTFRLRASTWDPVQGAVDSTASLNDRLRTNSVGARVRPLTRLRPKGSFDSESRDRLQENVIRVTKYVPLVLPVYVCNCPLSDVIDYLVCKNETIYEENLRSAGFADKNMFDFGNASSECGEGPWRIYYFGRTRN